MRVLCSKNPDSFRMLSSTSLNTKCYHVKNDLSLFLNGALGTKVQPRLHAWILESVET